MTKKTKKLIFGAGILGIGFSAVASATYAFTNMLVKVAIERNGMDKIKQTPKTKQIFLGAKENPFFIERRKNAAIELSHIEKEHIVINSFDGTKLHGDFRRCDSPKRVIIAMHGWRSSCGEDFGMMDSFFNKNNCHVLYTQQRGQGISEGQYMGFGLIERFDCFEWVKYINERYSLPIYLAGVSMGASTVLMASNLNMPENIKGIIADCGFTSPHSIWKHVANNNLKLSYGVIGKIANDICKKKIQIGTKDFSVPDAMKTNKIPVLFIHGTDDHFVPVTMTYENYKSCNSPKRIMVVPGADHAMSYFVNSYEYEKELISFWNEFDSYEYS